MMTKQLKIRLVIGLLGVMLVSAVWIVRTIRTQRRQQKLNIALLESIGSADASDIRNLLAKGADVNARREEPEPAFLALCRKALHIRRHETRNDTTPLMLACLLGEKDVAKILIDAGADINARDDRGFTPLLYTTWYAGPENANIVLLLAEHGVDLNTKAENGQTFQALGSWNLEIVQAFRQAKTLQKAKLKR